MSFYNEISFLISEIDRLLPNTSSPISDSNLVDIEQQRQVWQKIRQTLVSLKNRAAQEEKTASFNKKNQEVAKQIAQAVINEINTQKIDNQLSENELESLQLRRKSLLREIAILENQKQRIISSLLQSLTETCSKTLEEQISQAITVILQNQLEKTQKITQNDLSSLEIELPNIIEEKEFQTLKESIYLEPTLMEGNKLNIVDDLNSLITDERTALPADVLKNLAIIEEPIKKIKSLFDLIDSGVNNDHQKSDEVWYLGIDFGNTGMTAVLLDAQSQQTYPIYWSLNVVKSFRLPCVAWAATPNSPLLVAGNLEKADSQQGITLENFKCYLNLAISTPSFHSSESISLDLIHQATSTLLATLNPAGIDKIGAALLSQNSLAEALANLQGVIVSVPAFLGDTYRFNLREAVLKAGLIKESGQIFFLEEAIASLISRSDITSGLTLLINSGASNTELAIVDIPANLHELKYTDFTLHSFAYAGNAFDQDILFELIYPQLQELQQYLHTLDKECPQIGEADQQRRDYVNLLLGSNPVGHSLLEAAKLVKLVLQQRSEFISELGNDHWVVRREELNSIVIPPFKQLLEQQINLLLQKTKKQANDITQIICTGGTSIGLKQFLSIWLAEKFPQAQLRQDTDEENILRVAKGLASLPLFPNSLDRPGHQYSDYFLLLEILETIPNRSFKIEELMGLLARRGINTRVCAERLIAFLKGELPIGLITNDPRLNELLAISECLDNSLQNKSLLLKDYEGNYCANLEVCQTLKQYLKSLLSETQQELTEPLIVNLPLVVS